MGVRERGLKLETGRAIIGGEVDEFHGSKGTRQISTINS